MSATTALPLPGLLVAPSGTGLVHVVPHGAYAADATDEPRTLCGRVDDYTWGAVSDPDSIYDTDHPGVCKRCRDIVVANAAKRAQAKVDALRRALTAARDARDLLHTMFLADLADDRPPRAWEPGFDELMEIAKHTDALSRVVVGLTTVADHADARRAS